MLMYEGAPSQFLEPNSQTTTTVHTHTHYYKHYIYLVRTNV